MILSFQYVEVYTIYKYMYVGMGLLEYKFAGVNAVVYG